MSAADDVSKLVPSAKSVLQQIAAAEADRAAQQARLDVEHLRAMTEYQKVADAWAAERATSVGQAGREARQVGGRLMLLGVAALPFMLTGIAVTLPFF